MFALAGCNDERHPLPQQDPPLPEDPVILNGIVQGFESDETGDVNGLTIQVDDRKIVLHFPPHTAQYVMENAKPLSVIQATVKAGRHLHDDYRNFELLSITTNGHSLDIRKLPPPAPQRGEEISVAGKVRDIKTDKAGRVRSFTIDKTSINLPPHIDMNMVKNLTEANTVTVKGYKRIADAGFVNIRGLNVVRPMSITIDSITYTIE